MQKVITQFNNEKKKNYDLKIVRTTKLIKKHKI